MTDNYTASQVEAAENLRVRYLGNVAVKLLLESNVLNIEQNLTRYLVEVDKNHQEQIKRLELERDTALTECRSK